MDDMATVVGMIERHVSTLSGASMELTTKDLQQWTKAYKEDKGHVAAFIKLWQRQKYEDFYLTPSRLMARMVGIRQKSSFLKVFAAANIEGMPPCALDKPCGHAQDFGTSGQAIPLVRTTR